MQSEWSTWYVFVSFSLCLSNKWWTLNQLAIIQLFKRDRFIFVERFMVRLRSLRKLSTMEMNFPCQKLGTLNGFWKAVKQYFNFQVIRSGFILFYLLHFSGSRPSVEYKIICLNMFWRKKINPEEREKKTEVDTQLKWGANRSFLH